MSVLAGWCTMQLEEFINLGQHLHKKGVYASFFSACVLMITQILFTVSVNGAVF